MTPVVPAVVGDLDRVVVEVTGDDRTHYLDDVLSQHLRGVTPPLATSALELGPHGEPNGVLDLVVLDDRVLLLVPRAMAEDVVGRLAGRTFLADARFARRDDLGALRIRGDADDVLAALGVGPTHGDVLVDGDVVWARWEHGADVVAPTDDLPRLASGIVDAGASLDEEGSQLDAAEVAAGVPRAPDEIAHGRLPEELGLLPTHVHLAKGCYPGQEAVARMWMLGRPRRHLAVVRLASELPPGAVGDSGVELTRSARVGDDVVGLAFVPRGTHAGDRPHEDVEVLKLVGADRDVPGHDPAMKRRRDR